MRGIARERIGLIVLQSQYKTRTRTRPECSSRLRFPLMKNKYKKFQPAALAALGVFLGRGAQADTIIDFDTVTGPNNAAVDQSFGDFAAASSDGVTVTGFGTPNIGLTWTGFGDPATRWEYYNDGVWSAGQL